MRILVTGSKGFVGSETVKLLSGLGHEVIHYDLIDGKDIREKEKFYNNVGIYAPDRILHLAAVARFAEADKNPKLAFETNVLGTKNVVEVASTHKIPLVFSSTGSVYMPVSEEPPITEDFKTAGNSVYGCSKLLGEKYVEESEGYWIILRYAHLYGKEKRHHGLIGGFLSRIERGLAPTLYGGAQSNDFTYIKDVARANVLALTAPPDAWRQAYNIGSGEELSAHDAGQAVCDVAGYKGDVEVVAQRTVDASRFVYDVTKAKNMLGFEAEYSFEAGLKEMFK